MIADTYGSDRSDEDLAHERATIGLDRTIAAFDGNTPVGGTAVCTRSLTVPHAVVPVAAFLGGTTLASLAAAGLVQELRPGVLAGATRAFRADHEPYCLGGRGFPAD